MIGCENGRSCAPAATSRLSAAGLPASYFACIHSFAIDEAVLTIDL